MEMSTTSWFRVRRVTRPKYAPTPAFKCQCLAPSVLPGETITLGGVTYTNVPPVCYICKGVAK